MKTFPDNFVWGVATAAPQIEGAAFADGKDESVWDRYCRIPGKVFNGDTLDVACDHYHRFKEDFALMRSLGITNYRLSIAWPRIYPEGYGKVNQAGIDFYHRLFDAMAENGITPYVTLFHWDLPQALEDKNGWAGRATVDAFGVYADTVVKEFSGKVKNWITLNEIRCFTILGYGPGSHKAPGRSEPKSVVNQTFHNALVCHGHGVRAVRAYGGPGARVGLTDNCEVCIPLTETPEDIAAAKAWFAEANIHILDAIARGKYAPSYLEREGANAPVVEARDFDLISLPTDFLGVNIYSATFVRAGKNGKPEALPMPAHYPTADSPWLRITPQAIYWGPRFCQELYGHKAIYVTENGCGYDKEPVVGGEVLDLHRREFVRTYLRELHRAVSDDVPVKGYFLWSLMDNFEWSYGFAKRFGLTWVDYPSGARIPKSSFAWYRDTIRAHALTP